MAQKVVQLVPPHHGHHGQHLLIIHHMHVHHIHVHHLHIHHLHIHLCIDLRIDLRIHHSTILLAHPCREGYHHTQNIPKDFHITQLRGHHKL